METVLEDLYNGRLIPFEQERSKRFEEARRQLHQKEEAFSQQLDEDLVDGLHELLAEYTRLLSIDMEEDFVNGFKLGARIMCQVFQDSAQQG